MMKSMTTLLAGTVVAATMVAAAPASAQSITIGPDGPGIDLRSRGQRERDYRREMRMRDRDDYYREQRFRDRDGSTGAATAVAATITDQGLSRTVGSAP